MDTIRWGIIGCGNVTEVKSGPGFYKAAGSELVAVMRRDGALAADYAKRHGVPRWYDDADALIADKEVDAVYVATPPGTHEYYAMKVLAAGKPCHMEKPMTRNGAEARRMVEAFRAWKVSLLVAYYRRALPRFLKVKEMVDGGGLGKLQSASYVYFGAQQARAESPVPWRLEAEYSGGGTFHDMMSHALDLLDFWLGPLAVRQAQVSNEGQAYAVEDTAWAELTRAADAGDKMAPVIEVEARFNGGAGDSFHLVGDKAQVRLSCFGNEPVYVKYADHREEIIELPNPPHVAMPLIQTVVDELRGRGKCPSTGESGLRTQQIMDDILRDYYGGREDGFWKRPWPGAPSVSLNR